MQKVPTISLHTGHTRYTVSTHAHEAGYDSFNTARVLLRIVGRYYTYLQECKATKEPNPEGRAALKLMDFIHKPDLFAASMEKLGGGDSEVMLPSFEGKFWKKFVNRLRVNGTMESEFVLA